MPISLIRVACRWMCLPSAWSAPGSRVDLRFDPRTTQTHSWRELNETSSQSGLPPIRQAGLPDTSMIILECCSPLVLIAAGLLSRRCSVEIRPPGRLDCGGARRSRRYCVFSNLEIENSTKVDWASPRILRDTHRRTDTTNVRRVCAIPGRKGTRRQR